MNSTQRIADRYKVLIAQPYEVHPTGIQNEARNIGELIFIAILEEFDQSIADKKGKPLAYGALSSKVQSKTPVEFPSTVATAFGTVWKLGNDGSHARQNDATVQEAESILNALYTCVEWYLYTHSKSSNDDLSITLPGKARELRKVIADYREQVIAAVADDQVSIDELNILHRIKERIPIETLNTINTEFRVEQGIIRYLESSFDSKILSAKKNQSKFRSLTYTDVLSKEELELLEQYITTKQIKEVFKTAKTNSVPKSLPKPKSSSKNSKGQGSTDMFFFGLIWLMVIALLEIAVGHFFELQITDSIFFPISLELTLILIGVYHINTHKESTFYRKTSAYILSGLWMLVGTSGIFIVYSWDDVKPRIQQQVSDSFSEQKTYFYSLDGNVLEVNEHDLVEAIRLTPEAEHMIYNNKTKSWGTWDSYPNIVKAVKQQ